VCSTAPLVISMHSVVKMNPHLVSSLRGNDMAIAALIVGVIVWLVGLWSTRVLDHSVFRLVEFWWVIGAFGTGGLATLGGFGFISAPSDLVTAFELIPLTLAGLFLIVENLRHGARIHASGLFLTAFFMILVAFAVGSGDWLMPLSSLAVFLPCLIVPSRGYSLQAIKAGVAVATALALGVIGSLALIFPRGMVGQCRGDKCSLWGESLGMIGTGNALGLFLAVAGAICALLATRMISFFLISFASLMLVDLTSSRSAIVALGLGLVVALAFKISMSTDASWPLVSSVILLAAAALIIPLWPWTQNAFTGRSELWERALVLLSESPLFGYGSSYWVSQTTTSALTANYATHNLFAEVLVSSGIVGAMVLALAVISVLVRAERGAVRYWSVAVVSIWIASSLTEVVSAPGRVYLLPGLAAFVFLVANSTSTAGAGAENPNRSKNFVSTESSHRADRAYPLV